MNEVATLSASDRFDLFTTVAAQPRDRDGSRGDLGSMRSPALRLSACRAPNALYRKASPWSRPTPNRHPTRSAASGVAARFNSLI